MGICKVRGYDWSTLYFLSLGIGVLACSTLQHIKDVPAAHQLGWSRAGVDGVEPHRQSPVLLCALPAWTNGIQLLWLGDGGPRVLF